MKLEYSQYLQSLHYQISSLLATDQKYYVELTGELLSQTSFSAVLSDIPLDFYKQVFGDFVYDLDLLICLSAQDILDASVDEESETVFRNEIALYLKKVEHLYSIKPHVVITSIDIENMYDLVFSFETYFQKLGYRTWEKYKIKSYAKEPCILLGEDYLGSDDHIPTMKQLNLITEWRHASGKTMTAIAQCSLDRDIGIDAEYRLFFPFYHVDSQHVLNQLGEQWYHTQEESQASARSLLEKFHTEEMFLKECYRVLGKTAPEHFIIGNIPAECYSDMIVKQVVPVEKVVV